MRKFKEIFPYLMVFAIGVMVGKGTVVAFIVGAFKNLWFALGGG